MDDLIADVDFGRRRATWHQFAAHRLALLGAVILAALGLAAVVGPWLLGAEGDRIAFDRKDQGPSWSHIMGTDELGRDQLLRVLEGGRLTLAVAVCAVAASVTIGLLIGLAAGYIGGVVDTMLMRLVDVFYSLPALFVVIMLVSLRGTGFWTIAIAIAAFGWMSTARLVRASTLTIKERDYVAAARSAGIAPIRIAVRHVLPNTLGPVIVTATLGIAIAILTESALSFLGLGFSPPRSTWGGMLEQAQRPVLLDGHWWRGLFPGLMIFVTVLASSFVGDGLRDALDPGAKA